MKKLLALLLAAVMFVTLQQAAVLAESPKTLTVMVATSSRVEDYDTNAFILWLEEQTGIDVTWIQVPSDSWEDKVSTVILSGALPDVICSGNLMTSKTKQALWAEENVIVPLDDLIEQYGNFTKDMFAEQVGVDNMIRLDDGHIYALPTYSDIIHTNYSSKMFICDAFLEALNMEAPTTIDEFYNYLVAVKEQDVNGNGDPNDEVPLYTFNNWGGDLYTFIMNSFIPYAGRNEFAKLDIDENGSIYSVLDKDAFRDGLSFIAKLYREGLIYEGALSGDAAGSRALGESGNGHPIIGAQTGSGNYGGLTGGDMYRLYSPLSPLTGPTGLRITPWYRYVNVREGRYMITSACKDVESAMKLGDFLYSYDSTMRLRHGEYGTSWVDAEDGQMTIDGRPAVFNKIIPYGNEVQNLHLDNDLMFYETRGVYLDDAVFGLNTDDLYAAENMQWFMSEATKKFYVPYGREVVPAVTIPTELVDEYNIIDIDLNTYREEMMASFLTGELNIDNDDVWEEYKQGLYDIGLERYVEIFTTAYNNSALKWGE